MDMSKLRDTLPAGGRTDAERDLTNDFKAAALSITKLYKSSLAATTSAWSAGYQAALTELLEKLAGGGEPDVGVTVDDIKEWARARMDAIGGGPDSADVCDEEREREREREERERRSQAPSSRSSKPPSAGEDALEKTPTTTERARLHVYSDSVQDTPEEERTTSLRTPSTTSATRTPFSSPTHTQSHPASATKSRSRRSQPLRDTTPVNPFAIATTFAPSLPAISEFPFFPAAIFEPTQPVQYGPGMKRRYDGVEDGNGAAGRKARMRERGSGDSMDVDGERDKKRRR